MGTRHLIKVGSLDRFMTLSEAPPQVARKQAPNLVLSKREPAGFSSAVVNCNELSSTITHKALVDAAE